MKKIGVIDSGIGGLTILKDLMSKRLDAEFWYISDEENVPYGGKSQDFMFKQMTVMTSRLIEKGVDGILIACNTATSETIDTETLEDCSVNLSEQVSLLLEALKKEVD